MKRFPWNWAGYAKYFVHGQFGLIDASGTHTGSGIHLNYPRWLIAQLLQALIHFIHPIQLATSTITDQLLRGADIDERKFEYKSLCANKKTGWRHKIYKLIKVMVHSYDYEKEMHRAFAGINVVINTGINEIVQCTLTLTPTGQVNQLDVK